MPKALKAILLVLLLVILLVAGLLGYVMFAIDPNDYKSQLEAAADKQGVQLQIDGELGWSLFPSIGLEVGRVELASEIHNLRPSSLESARLNLALLPLLQKRVIIEALGLHGADLHLERPEQAAAVAAAPTAATDVPAEQSGLPFSLAIEEVDVSDSRVTLYNADGTTTVIGGINLSSPGFSAAGEVSPVSLSLDYPLEEKTIAVAAEGEVSYAQASGRIDIPQLQITVENLLDEPVSARLAGQVDLAADTARLQLLQGGVVGLSLSGEVNAVSLTKEPTFEGHLEASSEDLKAALEAFTGSPILTGRPDALENMRFSGGFSGNTGLVTLEDLNLALDDTLIGGEGALRLEAPKDLKLTLKGNRLNLDHYTAPVQEESAQPQEEEVSGNEALLAPLAGVVAFLDGGKAAIDLAFDSLVIADAELANPEAKLRVDGDKLSLSPLQFGAFHGKVNTTATINMANQPPAIVFNLAVANVDIARAQRQFAEDANLSGRLTMNMQGSTSGESAEELMDHLAASGDLAIADLHLASVNLERSYCEIAQLVERNPPREAPWPEGTDLDAVAAQFTIEGRTLYLRNYVTGVGNLKVRGQGAIDLAEERFDVDVIANLQGDRTSADGCAIKSKRIRNRDIPLECKDSFAEAGATSCKPGEDFVRDALKGELLDKLLPEGENGEEKPLEGLLRGLLDR